MYETNHVVYPSTGAFRLTVSELGAVAGTVSIQGKSLTLKGNLDSAHTFAQDLTLPDKTKASFRVNFPQSSSRDIAGLLQGAAGWKAELSGGREAPSTAHSAAGKYSFALPGGGDGKSAPKNFGAAVTLIKPTGEVVTGGVLAAGKAISSTGTILNRDELPLYMPVDDGLVVGWVAINPFGLGRADVVWIVLPRKNTTYPKGFALPLGGDVKRVE